MTKRVDETPNFFLVPRSPRPIIQDGGRSHDHDVNIQSWAVTQVLTTEKVLNRRQYVPKSVLYRFDVEPLGP